MRVVMMRDWGKVDSFYEPRWLDCFGSWADFGKRSWWLGGGLSESTFSSCPAPENPFIIGMETNRYYMGIWG